MGTKASCTAPARQAATKRTGHLAAIPRKNRNSKNRDRDRWETQLRAPSERVLAQRPKRGVTAAWPRINLRSSCRRWCVPSHGWSSSTRTSWRPKRRTRSTDLASKEAPLLPDTHSRAPSGECLTGRRSAKTVGAIVWAIALSPETAHRFFQQPPWRCL
jgi:hypothetical protein